MNLPKIKIDPSKITNQYSLLAVFLVVSEGLLGFWMYQAENATERLFVGLFILLILLAFLRYMPKIIRGDASISGYHEGIEDRAVEENRKLSQKDKELDECGTELSRTKEELKTLRKSNSVLDTEKQGILRELNSETLHSLIEKEIIRYA